MGVPLFREELLDDIRQVPVPIMQQDVEEPLVDQAKVEDDLLPTDEHSSAPLPVYTVPTCNWEGTVWESCAIKFPQGWALCTISK